MNSRVHILISGEVIGVSFRWQARAKAEELGLSGWARNTGDDKVEIVAEGEKARIEELLAWARRGPAWARVADVEARWENYQGEFEKFEIRL